MFKNDIYNRSGWISGVITLIITIIFFLVIFHGDFNQPNFRFKLNLTFPVTMVFLTGVYYRAVRRNLDLQFTQLIRMSLWIVVISAIGFAAFYWIYIVTNHDSFMAVFIQDMTELMKNTQKFEMTEEQFNLSVKELQQTKTSEIVFSDLSWKLALGAFATFVVSVILRK